MNTFGCILILSRGRATRHLAVSVGRQVGLSVRWSVTFLNSKRFSHYCSCPTVRDWIAVYPALFMIGQIFSQLQATRQRLIRFFMPQFLVADTRLYTLLCRSVGRQVGRSFTFLNCERFLHYCSCPTIRDWILHFKNSHFLNFHFKNFRLKNFSLKKFLLHKYSLIRFSF